MKSDIRKEIINRLIRDYNFKEENNYLRYGVCPQCGKKELFTSLERPYIVHCGRENKCGTDLLTKELYPDVFSSWSDRYISTKDEPYAAAAAYLQEARNIAVGPLKGAFTQERYQDKENGEQAATVRFTLADGVWWERIIDRPGRFARKANFSGSYKGLWWAYPGADLSKAKEIWICEGIFDAISLNQNGIAAVSVMSAVNYPDKALEELAKLCGDNPRPVIVWALDNGRAGERYAKKHAERSAEDGWRTAAALPGKNNNKRDWNDLHIAGKLRGHDVKRYRYYGDLLLAKSPRDKALIMFSFRERKEFHFTFDNRVFWFKLDIERHMKAVERVINERNVDEDEARKIALKESGAVKEIANCNPAPLYYIRNNDTDEAWYYFRVTFPDGATVKNTFTSGQLTSASEFKKRLLHVAKGGIYTGTTAHLDALIKNDLPAIKNVIGQDFIGYNKEIGAWLFNDVAVCNGKTYEINEEDYFEIDGINAKPLNKKPILQINYKKPDEFTISWVEDLWLAFGEKGIITLAFWLGSLFSEQIRQKNASYPFLEITGEPGTGKTTLIDFCWRLCGRDNYEGVDPTKGSESGWKRTFGQVAGLPVVLIEADRGDNAQKRGAFDFDNLKSLYNGGGIGVRGVKTNDNATYDPVFKGAVVIAQNATVSASSAIIERLVRIYTDKKRHSPDSRLAAKRLELYPVEQVSGFIHRAVSQERAIMDLFMALSDPETTRLYSCENIRHQRIAKNHAQLIALVRALKCVIDIPDEWLDATCLELERMAEEQAKAVMDDLPEVMAFWEAFDYLDGITAYGVNHFGKGRQNEFAVSIPQLEQVAAVHHVKIQTNPEMIKLLRAGRSRSLIGYKSVRSEVSRQANAGRGIAEAKEKEVLKCWIFSNKEGA
ncbi:toprim domain-containing protein [Escherichia coli]|uniref:toprim domain-containing protein n=1 Tax=Enterobacteriaceae TaxID=543 RepID=UPI000E5D4972|nr:MULTISPECIES: toprim domain-containing protein [Enterobacteriaceae]EGF7274018.1 toprim domain-containing protein [Shigella flexneri]EES2676037.1 toprim domain-containing protein [Escherichia coli]EFB5173528.1 toprim domain-containing protein [Escherichia coli]EFB9408228.1 toprim domain-containing protein [Escherichia coli]EFC4276831.1 toprim domain-containing protein [Escherichia coli]